ncbi:hypothetical protein HUO13_13110 [Saccharopolyspora erythraea]|uniref:hypothetical protein n=1 Tax=Saccharopolyspora erythraea TaxID=1836 RepID=UPI001BA57AF1|nr:hypothetical protein [Saccharopolyspora erythraea]QUH01628.1 hypothetical protein HUO13_13110 [Saccharopolyspora erythraea]
MAGDEGGNQIPLDAYDQRELDRAQAMGALPMAGPVAMAQSAVTMARAARKANAAEAASAGTTMLVDPDQVDKLARFFDDEAQAILDRAMDRQETLTLIPPPGKDPVSTQAADTYVQVATGSGDGYLENFQKLAKVFSDTAANLRASAQQTRTNDQDAAGSFNGGSLEA